MTDSGCRAEVNERPASSLTHGFDAAECAIRGAHEIRLNRFKPLFERNCVKVRASVVHQDIHAAIIFLAERNYCTDVTFNTHIGAKKCCGPTLLADQAHGFASTALVDVRDDHRRTLARKPPCDSLP